MISFQMYLLINVKCISVARFNFSLNFPCFCKPESPPSPIIWQCTLSLFIFYCADRSSEAGNSTKEMECLFNNFFLIHWNWSMTFYLFRVNKHKLKTYLFKQNKNSVNNVQRKNYLTPQNEELMFSYSSASPSS